MAKRRDGVALDRRRHDGGSQRLPSIESQRLRPDGIIAIRQAFSGKLGEANVAAATAAHDAIAGAAAAA